MGGQGSSPDYLKIAKQARAEQVARSTTQAEPTAEQKWIDYLDGKLKEIANEVDHRSEQQDGRITELENRCFKAEGQIADLGFRIADHDHQLNNGGITGTAKRWPVVTSQILAAAFNVLVILPAAVWDYLPAPWPLVIGAVLQAVAAVIGGQLTESKAELSRLQDGQRVAPLPYAAASMSPEEQTREEWRERFTHPMNPADKLVPPTERYGASAFGGKAPGQ